MRNSVIYTGGEAYDRIFKALGDPHRIRIVALLREKELSAGEILEAMDVVQSTLSHHMKTLADSGAVNAVRRGKWTYYSLNESNLAAAAAFLEEYAKGTRVRRTESAPEEETPAGSSHAAPASDAGAAPEGSIRKDPEDEAAGRRPGGDEAAGRRPGGDEAAGKRPAGDEPFGRRPAGGVLAKKGAEEAPFRLKTEKSGKKKEKEKDKEKKAKKSKKNKK